MPNTGHELLKGVVGCADMLAENMKLFKPNLLYRRLHRGGSQVDSGADQRSHGDLPH